MADDSTNRWRSSPVALAASGLGSPPCCAPRARAIVIADIDGERGRGVAAAALDPGGEHALAVGTDVTVAGGSRRDGRRRRVQRWGRIDILAANAGIYPHIPLADARPATDFDQLIAINVRGARVRRHRPAWTAMRATGYGRIVLTSSITGSLVGQPGYSALRSVQGRDARLHALGRRSRWPTRASPSTRCCRATSAPPASTTSAPSTSRRCSAAIPLGVVGRARGCRAGRCASWPRPRRATSPARRW